MPKREDRGEVLHALWRRAQPLSQSRYLIGSEAERTRLQSLEKAAMASPSELRVMLSDWLPASQEKDSPSQADIGRAHWHQRQRKQRDAMLDSLGNRVITAILRQELIGLGYGMPRRADDPPAVVPDDCWRGWIGWDEDTVQANGLKMVAVRLIRARAYWDALNDKPDDSASNSPGRGSRKEEIETAYRELVESDPACLNLPRKTLWQAIRRRVQERLGLSQDDERNLRDETIKRHIRPLIQEYEGKKGQN